MNRTGQKSNNLVVSPDWTIWSKKKHIKLSQAVLLANNICPNNHKWSDLTGLGEQLAVKKWDLVHICQDWLKSPKTSWVVQRGGNCADFDTVEVDWQAFKKWLEDEIDWVVPQSAPWEIVDPRDPPTKEKHVIATRYFARLDRQADPNLTQSELAELAVKHLINVRIFKRGGVEPFQASSLVKALHKITF
jgi:hypothetical protein